MRAPAVKVGEICWRYVISSRIVAFHPSHLPSRTTAKAGRYACGAHVGSESEPAVPAFRSSPASLFFAPAHGARGTRTDDVPFVFDLASATASRHFQAEDSSFAPAGAARPCV